MEACRGIREMVKTIMDAAKKRRRIVKQMRNQIR